MSQITDRISYELDFLGFTRADLCRATGIPESTIRNWIRGTAPQAAMLYKVAHFLNVSLEYLITGKNPPPKEAKISRENLDFLDSFLLLPEDEQNEIKELIKIKMKKYAKATEKKPCYLIYDSVKKKYWIVL